MDEEIDLFPPSTSTPTFASRPEHRTRFVVDADAGERLSARYSAHRIRSTQRIDGEQRMYSTTIKLLVVVVA